MVQPVALNELPIEILITIVSILDYPDHNTLKNLNKFWYELITANYNYIKFIKFQQHSQKMNNWFKFDLKPDLKEIYELNYFKTLNHQPIINNQSEMYNNYNYIYGLNLKQFNLVMIVSKLIVSDRLKKKLNQKPDINELITRQILKLPLGYHLREGYYNDFTPPKLSVKIIQIQRKLIFSEFVDSWIEKFRKFRKVERVEGIKNLIRLYESL